ncbi:unnamed protein product [Prunus armeniaca]
MASDPKVREKGVSPVDERWGALDNFVNGLHLTVSSWMCWGGEAEGDVEVGAEFAESRVVKLATVVRN